MTALRIAGPRNSTVTRLAGSVMVLFALATLAGGVAPSGAPADGQIAGHVTATGSGAPVAGVTVTVYNSNGANMGQATTDAAGAYTVGSLAAGTYYARTSNALGYINELYDNILCVRCTPTTGTPVSVTAGSTTSNVDFALSAGGRIAGTITEAGSGLPIANAWVEVFDASGVNLGNTPPTGADGQYAFAGGFPAGTYYARTYNRTNHVNELHNDLPTTTTVTSGTAIVVSVGITSTVNFALAAGGGGITGVLTDAGTSAPITTSASVSVFDATGKWVTNGNLRDSSGTYTLNGGLPSGNYYVVTSNGLGYLNEVWNNIPCLSCTVTTGTPVAVTAGAVTGGINFALDKGGQIAGRVSAAASGAPLSGATVYVYDSQARQVGNANTNTSGDYAIPTGLPAGTYFARSTNTLGYVDQLYSAITCPGNWSCTVTDGTPIPVTLGVTTPGVDFSLAVGGRFAGRITDSVTGAGLARAWADVYDPTGRLLGSSAQTDSTGNYNTFALPAGTYFSQTNNSVSYTNVLYNGLPPGPVTTGTPIAVTVGSTTPNINFALIPPGSIAGIVTGTGGAPLAGVSVRIVNSNGMQVSNQTTNASGNFSAGGLAAGTYYARTVNTIGYIDEVFDNKPCVPCSSAIATQIGAPIVVPPAGVTPASFALEPGARVSGTVTAEGTGALLAGVTVTVYSGTGPSVATGTTNASGQYTTTTGLTSGTYFARTSNGPSMGYANELYDGLTCLSCSATSGTPVALTAPTTRAGINFSLPSGGAVAGRVTDQGTGLGLANYTVYITDQLGRTVQTVATDTSGYYSRGGLLAGTYYVQTRGVPPSPAGYIDELYNNITCIGCTPTTGTPVLVTPGSTTGGIDFALSSVPLTTNDLCSSATVVGGVPFTSMVNTSQATSANDPWVWCGNSPPYKSVWYRFTAPADGVVTADTIGSNYDTVLAVYTGSCGSLTMVSGEGSSCHDDIVTGVNQASQIRFRVAAGTTYSFMISTWNNAASTLVFHLDFVRGGWVSGVVTDAVTGAPLVHATVVLLNPATWDPVTLEDPMAFVASTDAAGAYTAGPAPPGSYRAVGMSEDPPYSLQLFDHAHCSALTAVACDVLGGTPVSVTAGVTTPGVNFQLSPGGRIAGTATDAATSLPVSGFRIRVVNAAGDPAGGTDGPQNGSYITDMWGLPPGVHYVQTSNSQGYIDRAYNDQPLVVGDGPPAATPVPVAAGQTTPGIDFSLVRGGRIAGVVYDPTTHGGLPGVTVKVRDGTGREVDSVVTDSSGRYATATGLATGSYYVHTDNAIGYVNELYDDLPCPYGCPTTGGTPVAVTAGATTNSIDFALERGGRIVGSVLNQAGGAPIKGVEVGVFTGSGVLAAHGFTDATGAYFTEGGLPAGTYYARTMPGGGLVNYKLELFDNLACPGGTCNPAAGTPIVVTGTATTGDVGFSLAACSLAIAPSSLPAAFVGTTYNRTISPSGGTGPYVYSVGGGTVPFGLALNPATGVLSGTPITPGPFTFLARVVDAEGCVGHTGRSRGRSSAT